VAFPHPMDGRPLAIDAPLPAELVRLLEALRAAEPDGARTAPQSPVEASDAAEQSRQRGRPEPSLGSSE